MVTKPLHFRHELHVSERRSMIRSLADTCISVYAGSPSGRYLHTKTIDVQGAAARMMTPGMYWSASPGPTRGRMRCLKNSHPRNAIENA